MNRRRASDGSCTPHRRPALRNGQWDRENKFLPRTVGISLSTKIPDRRDRLFAVLLKSITCRYTDPRQNVADASEEEMIESERAQQDLSNSSVGQSTPLITNWYSKARALMAECVLQGDERALSEAEYADFREKFLNHKILQDFVPAFLAESSTSAALQDALKDLVADRDDRRDFARNAFSQLISAARDVDEGRTTRSTQGSAQIKVSTSSWTGRRSKNELIHDIKILAPLALEGLKTLIEDASERKFNDPDAEEALTRLRLLHETLGELLAEAQRGNLSQAVWIRFLERKDSLVRMGRAITAMVVGAPIIAVGTATTLEWLSGASLDGQSLATLCGAVLGADVIVKGIRASSRIGSD